MLVLAGELAWLPDVALDTSACDVLVVSLGPFSFGSWVFDLADSFLDFEGLVSACLFSAGLLAASSIFVESSVVLLISGSAAIGSTSIAVSPASGSVFSDPCLLAGSPVGGSSVGLLTS